MNVSRRWLEALLGRSLDTPELVERLAMLGTPVEAVEPLGTELNAVVVAEVHTVQPHPNADRLWLCRVFDGTQHLDVVCGAPNVTAGRKYPFAPPESVLPGGFKLKRRKIRGVVSNGMLCSAKELAMGSDADGILELDTTAPPGTGLARALDLEDDCIVIDVTPNRGDLLSIRGVARELAAVLGGVVKLPVLGDGETPPIPAPRREAAADGTVHGVRLTIEDVDGCPRYMLAIIRGVRVGPSPAWLQDRLRAVGQRPVNNVVDASNYVLFELNQPTHAFDLARLKGPRIVVRRARHGETLRTLDGETRTLTPAMTTICDAERPIGVGGVMGGQESEVSDETTDIALECAAFELTQLRNTRKVLDVSTDASYRYERGTDVGGMTEALRRVMELILLVAGGEVPDAPLDLWPAPTRPRSVFLRPSRVAHVLGIALGDAAVQASLGALGCVALPKGEDRLAVQIPTWRHDLIAEIDLIEEVARIHGYDRFPDDYRAQRGNTVPSAPVEAVVADIRRSLVSEGLFEARTLPFTRDESPTAVRVANPIGSDQPFLRESLLPELVRRTEYNWSNRVREIRLFEIGTVFAQAGADELPREETRVGVVVTGARYPPHWTVPTPPDWDLWDLKGLFHRLNRLAGTDRTVQVEGEGWVAIAPDGRQVGEARSLPAGGPPWAAPVFGLELLVDSDVVRPLRFEAVPATPPVERDLALLVPPGASAAQVGEVVHREGGRLLESVAVFDEYRGEGLPANTRSVAFRLTFRHPSRTLRDAEVDKIVARVLASLEESLGVRRR